MAVTQAQVAQLYVALFNRAPEGAGLNAWVSAGAAKTQAQIADDMLKAPAVQSYFNGSIDSDKGYIENIYKNILGKDYSQDPAGIDAWVRHLQAGHTRGETLTKLFEVAASAEAKAADPRAAKIFENKSAVAAYMAEKIGDIGKDGSGNFDYAPFQEIIRTTNESNLEAQKAKIDELASKGVEKSLTDGLDNITGTAGNDVFNGVYYAGNGTQKSTLSPLDKIDGGAGKDTLNLTVFKNDAPQNLTTTELQNIFKGVSSVENLNLISETGFDAAGVKFNFGLENLNISTIGDVSISETDATNKVSVNTTGKISLNAKNAQIIDISAKSDVTLIAQDAKTVNVNSEGKANIAATAAQTLNLKAKGETEVVTSAKTVNIDLKSKTNALKNFTTQATDLTLANLKINDTSGNNVLIAYGAKKISVTDVDFGANSIRTDERDVDFTMSYADEGLAKLSSSAADKVKTLNLHAKAGKKGQLDLGNIASLTKVAVDGGMREFAMDLSAQTNLTNFDSSAYEGGFSSLKLKNVQNATAKLGSGDDFVEIDSAANTHSIDGGAGEDTMVVTSAVATAATNKLSLLNFENLKITDALSGAVDMTKWANLSSVTLAGGAGAGAKIDNLANNSTIVVENAAIANDIAVNIKDAASGADDTLILKINPKANTAGLDNTGNFVIDGIENVRIASNADTAKTAAAKNVINLNASDATKCALSGVYVSGDGNTELKLGANIVKIKGVDASSLTGKFTFDVGNHVERGGVVKGGSGDDTLSFDSVAGLKITGGAGNDVFKVGKLGAEANSPFGTDKLSSITDFSKGDKLYTGGAAAESNSIAKYNSDASLDFANNLREAEKAAAQHASKSAYFTYQSNTYIVTSDGVQGVGQDDYVTKLAGTVDLSGARVDSDHNIVL